MKYISLLISCLEPLFISANWFMDVGHFMWWLESRCSLHKCWFSFTPVLTYRYNTNSIDTQFKKVTVVTSCINTLILSIDTKQSVSIHVPLYRYSWGFRPHGGYCQTLYRYFWGEYRYSSTGIDTYTLVSIYLRFHAKLSYCQALYRHSGTQYQYSAICIDTYVHCINTFEGYVHSIDTYVLSIDTCIEKFVL